MDKTGLLRETVLPGTLVGSPVGEVGIHYRLLQAEAFSLGRCRQTGEGMGGSLTWFRKVSILRRMGSGTWMVHGRRWVSPNSRKEARLYMAWVSGSLFRSTRPRLCREDTYCLVYARLSRANPDLLRISRGCAEQPLF